METAEGKRLHLIRYDRMWETWEIRDKITHERVAFADSRAESRRLRRKIRLSGGVEFQGVSPIEKE